MRPEDTATLNQHALAARLREQGLKQYWVADRVGVTKLTVNRWLTGRVRRISRDNLALLAKVLDCEPDALVYQDALDVHATQQEQSEAARLLVSRQSVELFMASGKHEIYEKLAKAVIHPNLPLRDLMQIYSTLTTAAYEQGKLEDTRNYARLYLDYALRCGDSREELSARSGIAASEGALGHLSEAIDSLNDLVSAAESVGRTLGYGTALCNLSHAYRLQGEMAKSLEALALLGAYVADKQGSRIAAEAAAKAAALALELGYWDIASRQQQRFATIAGNLATPQERIVTRLVDFLAASLSGKPREDFDAYRLIGEFTLLPVRPETSIIWPAILMRRGGNVDGARTYLVEAEQNGRLRIYDAPFVQHELARCAAELGEGSEALRLLAEANHGYLSFGMLKRRQEDPTLEFGSLFKRPPAARKILDFPA